MATFYRCDRCNDVFPSKTNNILTVGFPEEPTRYYGSEDGYKQYDLCYSCIRHINRHLETLPAQEIKNDSRRILRFSSW